MTAKAIRRYYILLNAINDTAYFGFFAIQFFLLHQTLEYLLSEGYVHALTLILIASQLIWQIPAEAVTGAIADLYGRVVAIALSFWFRFIALVLIAISVVVNLSDRPSSAKQIMVGIFLILAQMLFATGEASLEGSIQAWLLDECKLADPENHEEIARKTLGDSSVVQNVAILASTSTFLTVFIYKNEWKIYLVLIPACLCFIGAVISHRLGEHEQFKRKITTKKEDKSKFISRIAQESKNIRLKLYDAYTLIFRKKDEAQVRWLICVLILPFPCWIMLSWFFTAFVMEKDEGANLLILGLGFGLGVARAIGAYIGKWWSNNINDEKRLYLIFDQSISFNILSLGAIAIVLLIVSSLFGENKPLAWMPALFVLLLFGLAKGSEEIVKLSKDKYLTELPDSDNRATSLSLVSVAQNAFGFIAIFLTALPISKLIRYEKQQTIVIFSVCALLSFIGWVIYRIVYREPESQASVVEN